MKSRKKPGSPKRGNVAKALSYQWAMARVKDAIERGYFIEAVAIEESIISDRIWSYVHGSDKRPREPNETTLGALLRDWRKLDGPTDLVQLVERWKAQRNEVVHAVAKSTPGSDTVEVEQFLNDAKQAAKEGRTVMNKVKTWHQKGLRDKRKRQSA